LEIGNTKVYTGMRNFQLKKLFRVKTRQPMVQTPDTTFDKISMDIVESLPTEADTHIYSRYKICSPNIQWQSFKQALISSEITEADRKVYQPVYRAESMDYKSGLEFYKQRDALYSTSIKYLRTKPRYIDLNQTDR